jgi:hypothetical protein
MLETAPNSSSPSFWRERIEGEGGARENLPSPATGEGNWMMSGHKSISAKG